MIVNTIVAQGNVPYVLSIHTPRSNRPITGTNILQVVSAMVPSNKTTVEFFGGLGVPLGMSFGALMYTTYSSRQSDSIPYAQTTHTT